MSTILESFDPEAQPDCLRFPEALRTYASQPVPELTRSIGIQLNDQVSLRRKAKEIAWSAPEIMPIRTQRGEAAGPLYSAWRLRFPHEVVEHADASGNASTAT
jgi:hypothetical protein